MGPSWIRCGHIRGQEKSHCRGQESQKWKTILTSVRCGRSSKHFFLTDMSIEWPTCSSTVVSSPGKLSVSAHRSFVTYVKSTACVAISWNDCCARRTNSRSRFNRRSLNEQRERREKRFNTKREMTGK